MPVKGDAVTGMPLRIVSLGRSKPPVCICPPCWGGLCPPPACPVHGQTEMVQVRC